MSRPAMLIVAFGLFSLALLPWRAEAVDGEAFNETFNLGKDALAKDYKAALIACSVPANVLYPGDKPTLTFQFVNLTDQAIQASGKAELFAYRTQMFPDDPFRRRFTQGRLLGSTPFAVEMAAKGFATVTVQPAVPEEFGAYALVLEVEGHGRQFGAPLVRVVQPVPGKVQFPAFALDISGWNCYPETFRLFQRLGIKAIRTEIGFDPSDRTKKWLAEVMKGLWDHDIMMLITSAAGGPQPMGKTRKWLNDADEERTELTCQDMCPLPSADEDFQKWIEYMASTYGWPKGPVNAIELWNEPWDGCSISGWGADLLRYRDLYTRMALGIEDARKQAGVQVLIGGCCSSMNTEDKLFCDGKDTYLKWLDFTSIHYQPMGAFPSLIPEWVNRRSPYGPVRVWDTESWIANSEEHVSAVIAVMRAQGQSRTAGVLHDWTYTVTPTDVLQPDGSKKKAIVAVPWANAVAIAANQRFVGERTFKEILFKNGVPWVFVFDGLPMEAASSRFPTRQDAASTKDGKPDPDDGTLVVVGDIGGNTERDRCRFRTVLGLQNVAKIAEVKARLEKLPSGAPKEERQKLNRELIAAQWLEGASMALADKDGVLRAFDYFGNPIPATLLVPTLRVGTESSAAPRPQGKDAERPKMRPDAERRGEKGITIPLNISGYFLRTDGSPGSFEKLLKAVREADVQGYQPVEIAAHDFLTPIEKRPDLRLTLTNVLNRPVTGKLTVALGKLRLAVPTEPITLNAHETREILIKITRAREAASNTYPLSVSFDAEQDGKAELREDLHVNLIARRTLKVDGDLRDWKGILPQPAAAREGMGRNVTERAWQPYAKFDDRVPAGFTTAYLAYDDQFFYFAAKIADDTPSEGGVRFATRDDDAYFYPEKCYVVRKDKEGKVVERKEYVWPAGVRRYSYRKDPDLPSGAGTDNVQIAFGVFEPGKNGVYAYPPGTMPHFMVYQCTDYEYALNPVAPRFGGGAELWRLFAPGMPRKHFYPRQPKAERDGGPVEGGKLVMRREGNTRIVEAAIPWPELAEVKKRLDAGERVRFTCRVNDNKGTPYELAAGRSVSQINTYALHNLWEQHWSNELEFAFDKSR